jgi:hypothetical protein
VEEEGEEEVVFEKQDCHLSFNLKKGNLSPNVKTNKSTCHPNYY